jgi:homoserine dehydrogenase
MAFASDEVGNYPKVGVGLAGFGSVGAGVYKHLQRNRRLLAERLGIELTVRRIVVRDASKKREPQPPRELFVSHWRELIADPEVQIVVELIGGVEEAFALVTDALRAGKIVVTANKALLAEHGQEIFKLAESKGVPVLFEAAVAGGIPIIKAVQEGFIGNRIESAHGIINGTCNYILTRMANERGLTYQAALAEASALGYAEADPTLDVSGWDAAHKAIILASLAYGFWVPPGDVYVHGIQGITAEDFVHAKRLGYNIKLLAILKAHADGAVEVRVHPTMIPHDHLLAEVDGVFNGILLWGDVVGETLFYGRGAGQDATSSAVLSDLAQAATDLIRDNEPNRFRPHGLYGRCLPIEQIRSEYYLRLSVKDQPGVLAGVAGILANRQIGISSVLQPPPMYPSNIPNPTASPEDLPALPAADSTGTHQHVDLILMLHFATHRQITEALEEISRLPYVSSDPKPALIHVEHLPE